MAALKRDVDGIARVGRRARAQGLGAPGQRRTHIRTSEEGVEGFEPEDLALEDDAEVAGDGFGDGVQVEWLGRVLAALR
jgi:hypothetical protein